MWKGTFHIDNLEQLYLVPNPQVASFLFQSAWICFSSRLSALCAFLPLSISISSNLSLVAEVKEQLGRDT